ncbi:MAG: class I SAM-dependent methyltransferase family protein [Candidatus Hodarchaeota archaeon]
MSRKTNTCKFCELQSKESLCLKVPKGHGEEAIILSSKLKIINRELKVQRNIANIYIPLLRYPSESELEQIEQIPNFEIRYHVFIERKRQIANFTEILNTIPAHLQNKLSKSIDFVGDIAIIGISRELKFYKNIIGEALLKTHKNVGTVLLRASPISGTYRLRRLDVIAGEPKTHTVHKEYGCLYYVDLTKAYFSPRLAYEHNRIASLAKNGEVIVDLFSGIGPFAILIAKKHENVDVYAIDINPHAIAFLKKNIRLNKVENRVHPMLGNAKYIIANRLSKVADRLIMNLPEQSMEFIDIACMALKPTGGEVHFYAFVNANNSIKRLEQRFIEAVEKRGKKAKVLSFRHVRATAPYTWQIVLDAKIT